MIAPEMPSRTRVTTTQIIVIVPVQKAFSLFTRRSNNRPIHGLRLKPSADDRRPIQAGTQRDEAIPNCFGQTVECDYLSFLRAHEATQVTCPSLLSGVNH